jgi:hypothetical protein
MLTEAIAANVGSEAILNQYQAQYNANAETIDAINERLTGIPISSVPPPSTGGVNPNDPLNKFFN